MKDRKEILFAADLDNTLLYSRRHKREGDVCVERIKGEAHGFMTPLAVERLREVVQKLRLIPVTTRSIEQYRRIEWPAGTEPEYAVTTNGAVLLKNGAPDAAWREAHEAVIAAAREEVERCCALYANDPAFIRCRIVDDAYLFVYCADGVDAQREAARCQAQTSLQVEPSGRKIYFFPPGLTKGAALHALRARFSPDFVYAAGDTAIDMPLLRAADSAYAAAPLAVEEAAHIRRHTGEGIFAEWLLGEILQDLSERSGLPMV